MAHESPLEGFRISPQQDRIWSLQKGRRQPGYGNRCAIRILGDLDRAALTAAWQRLVDRHEILRMHLHLLPGLKQPVQAATGDGGHWLPDRDLAALGPEERPCLETLLDESGGESPSLALLRLGSREHVLLLALPAFQSDAIGLRNLARDLARCYAATLEGRAPEDEPAQYTVVADWLNDLLESEETQIGRKHWSRVDLSPLAELRLPRETRRAPGAGVAIATVAVEPGAGCPARLDELADRLQVAPETFLLACWQAFLARSTRQSRGLTGVAFAGRTDEELEVALGPFARVLPMPWDIDPGTSLATVARATGKELNEARQWQECFTWEELGRSIEKLGVEPFFPFAFEAVSLADRFPAPGVTFSVEHLYSCTDRFALRLFAVFRTGVLRMEIQHDTGCFAPAEARRWADRFVTFFHGALASPDAEVGQLEMISAAEREHLLRDYNRTAAALPLGKCLHELFEAQVERSPGHVAVELEGEELSYAELNARANRLAHHLRELGAGPESLVGICLDRSIEMAVALLGTLKAGAAWLPLDPGYPQDRLAFMLDDARPFVLLTRSGMQDGIAAQAGRALFLDRMEEELARRPVHNPAPRTGSGALAYVIYTSGSTGRPKGVMIRHRSIVNRLLWMLDRFPLSGDDRVLFKTPFSFDASIWEFFVPLFAGGRLVMARPGGHQDPSYLVQAVIARKVTVLQLVPSLLRVVLDEPGFGECRSLRRLFCGGEALAGDLVERLYAAGLTAELHNLYGPTEVAIDATSWSCSQSDARAPIVPLGRPIANVEVYLLDGAWRVVPEGMSGELYVGGEGLARGYHRRPELTAERFVPDACSGRSGDRLYKTGDLASHREDGSLEFLGRIDHQVKVRGFRIELGEIEAQLRRHPGAHESVVAARRDGQGGDRLVAYVVPRQRAALKPGIPLYRLPNGIEIAHLNKSETDWLFTEVFEERSYLQGGMTLRDGDVVFDVGANIGLFSLFVHATVRGARVFAFEPGPPTFEKLRTNIEMHGLDVELFDCGLSDAEKEVRFTFYPQVSASSGVYADPDADALVTRNFLTNQDERLAAHADELMAGRFESQSFLRPMRRLSDILRERGIERIDYLKIDVEKSELDVLRGIDEGDWPRIRQICMEVHDTEGRLARIVALLEEKGFEVAVDQLGLLANTGLYNLYAIHPSRRAEEPPPRREPDAPSWTEQVTPERLRSFLGARLPEHMIPAVFVLLDSLPRTPNGKIDRKALPEPEATREGLARAYVAPRTPLEERLAAIWADLLGLDRLGVEDNFFELGGHSLLATRLVSRLREVFQVNVPLRNVFEAPTVAALAERLEALLARDGGAFAGEGIARVPRERHMPLSFAQQRLWVFEQLHPGTAAYNVPVTVRLLGEVSLAALAATFDRLVERHESLRTTFVEVEGRAVQAIAPAGRNDVACVDLQSLDPEAREGELRRLVGESARVPFDLSRGSLLRVHAIRLASTETVVQIVLHHIVSDGWSMGVLVRELTAAYEALANGRPVRLPALPVQYADFAVWQQQWLSGPVLERLVAWWTLQLAGAPPRLALPFARPQPARPRFRGAACARRIRPALTGDLKALGQRESATLFMVLLAGFQALLALRSGSTDIVVGTDIAGRNRAETEGLIGFFINQLALRTDLSGNPGFRELLARVREVALGAYAHQDLPFERLVEALRVPRDLGCFPIFQAKLNLQNTPDVRAAELSGLRLQPLDSEITTSQLALNLRIAETPDGLSCALEYDADLFEKPAIDRLLGELEALLAQVAVQPGTRLDELEALLGAAERARQAERDRAAEGTDREQLRAFKMTRVR